MLKRDTTQSYSRVTVWETADKAWFLIREKKYMNRNPGKCSVKFTWFDFRLYRRGTGPNGTNELIGSSRKDDGQNLIKVKSVQDAKNVIENFKDAESKGTPNA